MALESEVMHKTVKNHCFDGFEILTPPGKARSQLSNGVLGMLGAGCIVKIPVTKKVILTVLQQ